MRFGGIVESFDQDKFLDELNEVITESVMKRVRNIPEIAHQIDQPSVQVLFSGGIDSTVLAAILALNLDPEI